MSNPATTTRKFQKGDTLYYLSPVSKKLAPCEVVGRDLTGKRPGQWSIKLLTTGLGAWAKESCLFTGFEPDLPGEFWNNPENWQNCQYGLVKRDEVEDYAKLENLDPSHDYGDIDPHVGSPVFGYWTPQPEGLTDDEYAQWADEYESA